MKSGSLFIMILSICLFFGCDQKEHSQPVISQPPNSVVPLGELSPTSSPTPVQNEFSKNLARWNSLGITNYMMKVSMDAHGATRSKQTVVIEVNGREIKIQPVKKNDPRSLEYFIEVNSVPKLFAKIEQFERDGWLVRAKYDRDIGYPKSIRAEDQKSNGWWSYEVLEFVPKNSSIPGEIR